MNINGDVDRKFSSEEIKIKTEEETRRLKGSNIHGKESKWTLKFILCH